jgi:hypothetical protein
MLKRIGRAALVGMMVLSLAGAMPATAKARAVVERGACGFGSDWRLKLAPGSGGIEVSFQIDSGVPGQTWAVAIFQNGAQVFSGTGVTATPGGAFSVRVVTSDTPGTDSFTGQAVNTNLAGEVCLGNASIG